MKVIPRAVTEEEVVWKQFGRRAFRQDFELPNGEVKDFYLLGASSKPVIIFPVTTDRDVVAIRQFRFAADQVLLEVPGGNAKGEQTAEDTARTELLEETGYQASEIIKLGAGAGMWFDPASWRVSATFVLATNCQKVAEQNLDATESIEVVKMPLANWLERIDNGEVADMKSIAITLMAMRHGI